VCGDDGDWSVIFSRRSDQLAAHAGQVAFPGGAVETGETLEQAVVREAEEEVGIPPRTVELIGRLDDVITNSGFLVALFAAVVHVPVEALLEEHNPEVRFVPFHYPAYFYHYGRYEIWGLTSRMLKTFLDGVAGAVKRR
jgi:mutator protein MutT